jgi:hypothetical protein
MHDLASRETLSSPTSTLLALSISISLPTYAEQHAPPQPSQAISSSTSLGAEAEQPLATAAERPRNFRSGSQRRLRKRLRHAALASQAGEVSSP